MSNTSKAYMSESGNSRRVRLQAQRHYLGGPLTTTDAQAEAARILADVEHDVWSVHAQLLAFMPYVAPGVTPADCALASLAAFVADGAAQ